MPTRKISVGDNDSTSFYTSSSRKSTRSEVNVASLTDAHVNN